MAPTNRPTTPAPTSTPTDDVDTDAPTTPIPLSTLTPTNPDDDNTPIGDQETDFPTTTTTPAPSVPSFIGTEATMTPEPTGDSTTNELEVPPSSDETDAACRAVDGVYGEITSDSVFLNFQYEVETDVSVDGDLEDDVLPLLENAFVDYSLQNLFPGDCEVQRRLTTTTTARKQQKRRRLGFVGISGRPEDTVSGDLCAEVPIAGRECNLIDGEITLYSDGGRFLTDEDVLRDTLRQGMAVDAFVNVHPSITRVSFVDSETAGDTGSRGTVENPGEEDDDGGSVRPLRVGLLVGAAVALLLGLIFTLRTARTSSSQPTPEHERNSQAEDA